MRKQVLMLLSFIFLFIPLSLGHANEDSMYIVSFKHTIDEQTIIDTGATIVDTLTNSPIAIIQADEQSFHKLQEADNINTIEKNQKLTISAEQANWGLEPLHVADAWESGYTGKGVKIAVIDTGVGPHEDLKVVQSLSFIESEPSTADLNGHGTHIAGIIGALHNDIGAKGIAPDAEIYGLKVFDQNGNGYTHDVIRALDWAIDHKIDIINMSLTSEVPLASYENLINQAYQDGMLIVGASGNSTATDPTVDNVEYPAKFESVIAVSSVDWEGNKGYYSAIGPDVEVVAPGVSIFSTHIDNTYTYLQGTSISTAFVTGHLALMKEAYPHLTNVQLRKKMTDDAIDLGPKGRDPVFGYGMIQSSPYRLPLYEYPASNNPVITLIASHEGIRGNAEDTVKVSVEALLDDGQIVDVSNFVKWTIAHPKIASSRNGMIDLHEIGETTLQASYGKKSIKLPIEVQQNSIPSTSDKEWFTDISKDFWAAEAIEEMHRKQIITGYEDNTFRPKEPIKRSHVAVMMTRILPLESKVPLAPFTDVKMSNPYYYEIMKTQRANIFSGDFDQFKPNGFLTRAQMAKIIVEAFDLPKAKKDHPFTDIPSTHWANDYISSLYEAGITTGLDEHYHPNQLVTRTHFAVFLHRAMHQ